MNPSAIGAKVRCVAEVIFYNAHNQVIIKSMPAAAVTFVHMCSRAD
jgi:hypothetical protein